MHSRCESLENINAVLTAEIEALQTRAHRENAAEFDSLVKELNTEKDVTAKLTKSMESAEAEVKRLLADKYSLTAEIV
jgi:hypothetical protein